MKHFPAAWVVIFGGVSAALHIGKLPPALPVLTEALGVSLLQAGFLLSLVQLAGMTLGLAAGLMADGIGLKRSMALGLLVLSVAGALGGWAQDAPTLLALRALEGLGLLMACMPAPSLLRRLVTPERASTMLGMWGACMPLGTAAALLLGPPVMSAVGWQGWWWMLALVSLAMTAWVGYSVPADEAGGPATAAASIHGWRQRLRQTLASRGPWLVAWAFCMYSLQWLAVIGFLPTIYAQAGLSAALSGALTALAAAVNIAGNLESGRRLQRGARPQALLYAGFAAMGFGAMFAFSPLLDAAPAAAALRYLAVLLFSTAGGLIPSTLFFLAVRLSPGERNVSTTVGWMQQWSAFGQLAGPPLVALVAGTAGGWHWTWVVTGGCALAGLGLAAAVGRLLEQGDGAKGWTPTAGAGLRQPVTQGLAK